jgi:hypothetical protein
MKLNQNNFNKKLDQLLSESMKEKKVSKLLEQSLKPIHDKLQIVTSAQ